MAAAPSLPNGSSNQDSTTNEILPGTTFADNNEKNNQSTLFVSEPHSISGPQVNGRLTTLTRFSPQQLAASELLPSLYRVINDAFRVGQEKTNQKLSPARLQYDGQLQDELGTSPGTFTFVVYYSGTDEVVATASAKPHAADLNVSHNGRDTTWKRLAPIADGKEAWELSTMAVDPGLQGQGLAGYLMRMAEEEVKRRFKADEHMNGKQLVLVITTVKERMEAFYLRRGFVEDYKIHYERGYKGSELGFHVIFMSKNIDV